MREVVIWGVCTQQEVLQVQVENGAEGSLEDSVHEGGRVAGGNRCIGLSPWLLLSYQKTHRRLPGTENISTSFPHMRFLFEQLLFRCRS